MLVDTHTHLDFEQFDADREQVLARAWEAGVAAVVNVGFDLASSRQAVELARLHERVYAAVGLHPHSAEELDGETLAELRALAQQPKVVAVGEIGLDFFRDRAPREVQRRAFQAQLAWAARLGRPVIIHDRDAHGEVLAALLDWARGLGRSALDGRLGVLHTFSGDLEMARKAIELGFYVSISGPVTYPNAHRLAAIVRELPLDRMLVETDSPFLPPQPRRGQRNEPAYLPTVVERIAELRGMDARELAEATTANAERLFGLKITHDQVEFKR